jgi:hypothetical protein
MLSVLSLRWLSPLRLLKVNDRGRRHVWRNIHRKGINTVKMLSTIEVIPIGSIDKPMDGGCFSELRPRELIVHVAPAP